VKKLIIASAALALTFAPALAASHHHKAKTSHHTKRSMSHQKGSTQPDASGQGGSGPGSDQGGTKAAPSK
jgi:hypothetical protein